MHSRFEAGGMVALKRLHHGLQGFLALLMQFTLEVKSIVLTAYFALDVSGFGSGQTKNLHLYLLQN
jgi:hypothetical protein